MRVLEGFNYRFFGVRRDKVPKGSPAGLGPDSSKQTLTGLVEDLDPESPTPLN